MADSSSTATVESAGCNINPNELQPGLNILQDWTGTRADVEEGTIGCFRMKIDTELFEGIVRFFFHLFDSLAT